MPVLNYTSAYRMVEGDREREKRGWEAGFPRWREAGKIRGNHATLRNILQSKNAKRRKPINTGRELGLKRAGSGRLNPPPPPYAAALNGSR